MANFDSIHGECRTLIMHKLLSTYAGDIMLEKTVRHLTKGSGQSSMGE